MFAASVHLEATASVPAPCHTPVHTFVHTPHPVPSTLPTPQVQYAQQCYDSKMVRMDRARGAARIAQDFVFADVRPLVARPLTINVYMTKSLE